jgi:hypothetical protein
MDLAVQSKKLDLTKLTKVHDKRKLASILVLRGNGDEAALALFLGELGNDIARHSFAIFSNFIFLFLLIIYFGIELEILNNINNNLITIFFLAIPALMFISIIVISIGACCKSIFGTELATGFIGHEIVGGAMPPGQLSVDTLIIAADQSRGGLKHSLYENSNCVPAIADWIKDQLDLSRRDC